MSLPSTSSAGIPSDCARCLPPSPEVIASVTVVEAKPFFSHTKSTGNLKTPAQFSPSKNGPLLIAPSPNIQHDILFPPFNLIAWPAPAAILILAETTPLAPSMPTLKSAICIEPPFP